MQQRLVVEARCAELEERLAVAEAQAEDAGRDRTDSEQVLHLRQQALDAQRRVAETFMAAAEQQREDGEHAKEGQRVRFILCGDDSLSCLQARLEKACQQGRLWAVHRLYVCCRLSIDLCVRSTSTLSYVDS